MKTTFEKELEGKERYIRLGKKDVPYYFKIVDVLKAKNKVKKEIIEDIDNRFQICYELIDKKLSYSPIRKLLKRQNKSLEIEIKKIIDDKL